MKIYFVTNEKWYSKLMRFLYRDEVTHIGIGYNESEEEIIFDITKPYGSVYPKEYWFHKYEKRYHIELTLTDIEVENSLNNLWKTCVMKTYDIDTYYWTIFFGILNRFFGYPIPTVNRFANRDRGLCTNVIDPVKEILFSRGISFKNIDTYSLTPQMILERFDDYDVVKVTI